MQAIENTISNTKKCIIKHFFSIMHTLGATNQVCFNRLVVMYHKVHTYIFGVYHHTQLQCTCICY